MVAFIGENGAGKTNLLEALSLFAPGRGLRRADLSDMARENGTGSFAISVMLNTDEDITRLGTGFDAHAPEGTPARRYRINGTATGSAQDFADYLRIVWLTPALDGLFSGPAGDRRRFIDRLVLALDPAHAGRVSALERALRARNKLLEDPSSDAAWLDAIEREAAETAVAVAAARQETVGRLAGLILAARDDTSPFPWADIRLEGWIENALLSQPAIDVEDAYRLMLRDNRGRDRAAGRTLIGPQASDLIVLHGPKAVSAERASTGEQKALLIGLVLAHAKLVADISGLAPLVLLDEVAAHLDPRRRAALYETLAGLGSHVFVTGADAMAFIDMPQSAERFLVTNGSITII